MPKKPKNLKNPENQRRERNIPEEAHEHFVVKTERHEETRQVGLYRWSVPVVCTGGLDRRPFRQTPIQEARFNVNWSNKR